MVKAKNKNKKIQADEVEIDKVTPLCIVCGRELVKQTVAGFLTTQSYLYCNNRNCKHFGILTIGVRYEK